MKTEADEQRLDRLMKYMLHGMKVTIPPYTYQLSDDYSFCVVAYKEDGTEVLLRTGYDFSRMCATLLDCSEEEMVGLSAQYVMTWELK